MDPRVGTEDDMSFFNYGRSYCWIPHQVGDDTFGVPEDDSMEGGEDDRDKECHALLDGASHQIPAFAGMTIKGAGMTGEKDSRSHFVRQE